MPLLTFYGPNNYITLKCKMNNILSSAICNSFPYSCRESNAKGKHLEFTRENWCKKRWLAGCRSQIHASINRT